MNEFGHYSTAHDVLEGIDLTGKTVLITGANSGLGLESARTMAAKGARIIMAGRNQSKLAAAVAHIREEQSDAPLHTMICDLASLEAIKASAEEANERFERIDVLINNAAVMASPLERTVDGFELQFGTNHLGHFALTKGLMPLIAKGAGAPGSGRIVNLSSRAHHITPVNLEDPHFERRDYNEWLSYGHAKTANALFTAELEHRFGDQGVHAYAVHPGGIRTNLSRHLSPQQEQALTNRVMSADPDFEWKSIPQGAATQVWAATTPQLEGRGGVYCEDCRVAKVDDESTTGGVRSYALDPQTAHALWTLSEEMTGEVFAP